MSRSSEDKTERECAASAIKLAEAAGYVKLSDAIAAGKTLKAGDKVYADIPGLKDIARYRTRRSVEGNEVRTRSDQYTVGGRYLIKRYIVCRGYGKFLTCTAYLDVLAVFKVDFIAALDIVSGIAVGFYLKRRRILNLLRTRRRQIAQVFIGRVVDLVLRRRVESYVNSLAARRRRQAVGARNLQGLVLQVDAARSRAAVGTKRSGHD